MKYQNLIDFKKSLEAAFPNNLRQLYFVIMEDDFERHRVVDFITRYLPHDGAYALSKKSAASFSSTQLIQELDAPSLLASRFCLIIDEVELYKKADLQKLADYLKKSTLFNYLVLAARNKKELLTLLNEVDQKGGLILDLFFESFFEKEKRFVSFINERCAQAKKNIAKEAVSLLLEKVGLELSAIENEIEKAINFTAAKAVIEEKDIESVTLNYEKSTIWQIAEKMVWKKGANLEKMLVDTTFFHALLPAIRYNLQEGYKLAAALEKRQPNFNYRALFPYIKPKLLDQRKEAALKLSSAFFKEALKELFKIDLASKNNVSDYLALLTLFQTKLMDYAANFTA